jgi:TolB-like protein/tetratricopeptide (TPR) repeat protein
VSRIFVSYARADRARVAPLAHALESLGHRIWWDGKMEGGAAFARVIEAELEAADAVVVVWSAASIVSDWVRDEAGRGRDRACLVPVLLDGVQPPLGFRQYHAIDISGWSGNPDAPELVAINAGLAACQGAEASIERPSGGGMPRARTSVNRRSVLAGAAGAVVLSGGGLAWWRTSSTAEIPSIAVLPFANLSDAASQAYFADGLAEELRAALMQNTGLQVAAPTSSANAREKAGDARTIASMLGVTYLLMGSVRRQGDAARITAELIDGTAGLSKWSRQFDKRLIDVFAVQREIADTVADAIAVRFSPVKDAGGGTTDPRAFDAYLRGLALFNADSGEASDRTALARFDESLAADPRFARALAARSRSLAAIATQYGRSEELRALYADAIATAERAVAVAPDLAAAQLALGFARLTGRLEVAGAKPAYDRAAQLGGGDADVLLLTAVYQARTGRDAEATAAIGQALARDPLNPRAFRAASTIHLCGRRYERAIAAARQALQLAPNLSNARANIGTALIMTGRARDALQLLTAERNPGFRLTGLAVAQRRLGDVAAAEASFARLVGKIGLSGAFQQAQVLAQWGRIAPAMAALATARRLGDAGLLGLVTDPLLLPLHGQPAFINLARELGFPSLG